VLALAVTLGADDANAPPGKAMAAKAATTATTAMMPTTFANLLACCLMLMVAVVIVLICSFLNAVLLCVLHRFVFICFVI
jgi:hypothetical protein